MPNLDSRTSTLLRTCFRGKDGKEQVDFESTQQKPSAYSRGLFNWISQFTGTILREKLVVLYPAKLGVLPIAVGMLTASIGMATQCWRRAGASVYLPAGAAVAVRQDSFVGSVRLSTLAAA